MIDAAIRVDDSLNARSIVNIRCCIEQYAPARSEEPTQVISPVQIRQRRLPLQPLDCFPALIAARLPKRRLINSRRRFEVLIYGHRHLLNRLNRRLELIANGRSRRRLPVDENDVSFEISIVYDVRRFPLRVFKLPFPADPWSFRRESDSLCSVASKIVNCSLRVFRITNNAVNLSLSIDIEIFSDQRHEWNETYFAGESIRVILFRVFVENLDSVNQRTTNCAFLPVALFERRHALIFRHASIAKIVFFLGHHGAVSHLIELRWLPLLVPILCNADRL